jgi:predicted metal-dependent peptidase
MGCCCRCSACGGDGIKKTKNSSGKQKKCDEKCDVCGGDGQNKDGQNKDGQINGQFDNHIEGDKDEKGNSQGKLKHDSDFIDNKNYWKEKIVEAGTQAKLRGKGSSLIDRIIGNLLEPKIDWRKRLFHFITKDLIVDFTMKRPGRRFHSTNVYTPSCIRENLEVLVAVDVSGSIGENEYNDFMTEVLGIANGFQQIKMRTIFWSTYVDEADDIEVTRNSMEKLLNHKVNNSGGTTMSCVKEYIETKGYQPRVIITLTDGYVESDPKIFNCPHLFVLSKNNNSEIVEKLGEVCKLSDAEK